MRVPALVLSALLLAAPAMAQDAELSAHACDAAVGTFLLSDAPEGGEITTRSLLLLAHGGHAAFVDSGQMGGEGYAPFSDALGRWTCLSAEGDAPRFRAVLLDFTFPDDGPQEIGRLDMEGMVDLETGELTLTALLSFFPLGGDPLAGPAADAAPFTITGEKVTVE